ncbi:MAG: 6,7-dimethyl-8-ribityllumazine synthase [Elusimicrobia bacterium]|nr:6,7-dimethyl-8-ribityllumazine synthase [Elusimicrobiota bacterium]
MKVTEGNLNGAGLKFAVAVSRFHEFMTGKLLEGAIDALVRHDVSKSDIAVVKVPGALELSSAARRLAESKNYNAVICLGMVIKGETSHNELVSAEAVRSISQVGMTCDVPVIMGVVTAENTEQAIERSGSKHGNRGAQAAVSAIEMANLWRKPPSN